MAGGGERGDEVRLRTMAARGLPAALAILAFVAVGTLQATNMILSRWNAGAVPPYALGFFRWLILALALAVICRRELPAMVRGVAARPLAVLMAGFCGMFLAGGIVYEAGITTSAINIGLIMATTPVIVLLVSLLLRLERVRLIQMLSIAVALPGTAIILARGDFAALARIAVTRGDVLMFVSMLGWAVYTIIQARMLSELSFLARICVYAAAGALVTLPFALYEGVTRADEILSLRALPVYLFAGLVPGLIAYAGFAKLGLRFGPVRNAMVMYVTPLASAVLSLLLLGEGPEAYHFAGGALILAGVWMSLRR